jgi:hypothetical protein
MANTENGCKPVPDEARTAAQSQTVSQTFRIEEFKALRDEIKFHMDAIYVLERNAIIAVVAMYAWLLTHHADQVARWGWWIPVAVPILAFTRSVAHAERLQQIGCYIRDTTEVILLDTEPSIPPHGKRYGWQSVDIGIWFVVTTAIFWVLLELATLFVGQKCDPLSFLPDYLQSSASCSAGGALTAPLSLSAL